MCRSRTPGIRCWRTRPGCCGWRGACAWCTCVYHVLDGMQSTVSFEAVTVLTPFPCFGISSIARVFQHTCTGGAPSLSLPTIPYNSYPAIPSLILPLAIACSTAVPSNGMHRSMACTDAEMVRFQLWLRLQHAPLKCCLAADARVCSAVGQHTPLPAFIRALTSGRACRGPKRLGPHPDDEC